MRKASAYARKRRAQGKALGHTVQSAMDAGFAIMTTIAASADRNAPPPPGGEFLEGMTFQAAEKSEKLINEALGYLLEHRLPADPWEVLQTINAALVLGTQRTLMILYGQNHPRDDQLIDLNQMPESAREAMAAFMAGRNAWLRTVERWETKKQWGLDAEARVDLQDAMDVTIQIMKSSTVQQMQKAYESAERMIGSMSMKGLI